MGTRRRCYKRRWRGGILSPLIKRPTLISNIQEDIYETYGIEVDKKLIKKIIEAEEEEVMMAIANNERVKFLWGDVQGGDVAPKRLYGLAGLSNGMVGRSGFSAWKRGVPDVKWSEAAQACELHDPGEYFEQDEYKYLTNARLYRLAKGLPEIPEYEGLSDEKIKEICEKADKALISKLPKSIQKLRKDNERDRRRSSTNNKIMREITGNPIRFRGPTAIDWLEDIPGITLDEDVIDWVYKTNFNELLQPPDQLEMVRRIIDLARDRYKLIDKHPELLEKEEELEYEIAIRGMDEIPHLNFISGLFDMAPNEDLAKMVRGKYNSAFGNATQDAILASSKRKADEPNILTSRTKDDYIRYRKMVNFVNRESREIQRQKDKESYEQIIGFLEQDVKLLSSNSSKQIRNMDPGFRERLLESKKAEIEFYQQDLARRLEDFDKITKIRERNSELEKKMLEEYGLDANYNPIVKDDDAADIANTANIDNIDNNIKDSEVEAQEQEVSSQETNN